jgi:glycosyltransferase involved in cell wall biosynthesis
MSLRILLSAYACRPDRGSEPAVGWNWALTMGQLGHRVTVLTQGRNRSYIEAAQGRVPDGVAFRYHEPHRLVRALKHRVPTQLYHLLWQMSARRAADRIVEAQPFDVVQHLTFCTIRQPSFMGSLPLPFILGPVAGGETAPAALRASFSSRGRRAERLRDLANLLTRCDPLTRTALRSARLVLAATPETAALVPTAWGSKVRLATQVGIESMPEPLPSTRSEVLRLLFVGRFLYWKGMDLGLEAVARLVHRQIPVALTMIGEGPEESRWRARAEQLGVTQHVSWLRWLPQAELAAHYRAHDALLFPSLHDSGGFVVLEALAQGLPVVCLALGGPGQMVTADCGEAIDTTELNVETCADALASALERVHRHPARDTLRAEAVARAREFDWQHVVGRAMSAVEGALRAPGSDSPP